MIILMLGSLEGKDTQYFVALQPGEIVLKGNLATNIKAIKTIINFDPETQRFGI